MSDTSEPSTAPTRIARQSGPEHDRTCGWLYLLAAAVILLGTLPIAAVSVALMVSGQRTSGTVARSNGLPMDVEWGDPADRMVLITFEVNGQPQICRSLWSATPFGLQAGRRVSVVYLPSHPWIASLDSYFDLWLLPLFGFCFVGCCLPEGWCRLRHGQRASRSLSA